MFASSYLASSHRKRSLTIGLEFVITLPQLKLIWKSPTPLDPSTRAILMNRKSG